MKLANIAWALCASTLVLAGCGGSSLAPAGGAPAVPNAPAAKHGPHAIVTSPASLSFVSSGVRKAVTVSEPGYKGKFTATAPAASCLHVATVKAGPAGKKFFVTSGLHAGKCKIAISDKQGNKAVLKAVVTLTVGSIH